MIKLLFFKYICNKFKFLGFEEINMFQSIVHKHCFTNRINIFDKRLCIVFVHYIMESVFDRKRLLIPMKSTHLASNKLALIYILQSFSVFNTLQQRWLELVWWPVSGAARHVKQIQSCCAGLAFSSVKALHCAIVFDIILYTHIIYL